ncbi:hypothetical protein [Algoriphagus marinus]|uniref:hypothetical protein n=1 Tax=Algoriphagus marinus TaxID=1925762 RepID=UPI00094BB7CC|nr:hypothetical protein [Algoriphagus marinus]
MQRFITFALFFFITLTVQAQFFLAGAHFNGSSSVGKLKEEAGSIFFPTISGFMLYEFQTSPIQIGLDLGYGLYGSKLEKRTDLYPGFNDELRLRRNNNIVTGMITMRYLPWVNTKFTPFIEAQFGGNYLYTRYQIRATIDEEPIEADSDHQDWAIAYRIGAGIQIPLPFLDEGTKLEFKTSYQDSNSIQFLTKGDVTYLPDQGNGEFDYNFRRGPLQLLTFSVGIVVYDLFH